MWWGFDEFIFMEFYKELDTFYNEVRDFVLSQYDQNEIINNLFKYQHDIIKKIGKDEITIQSEYDFYSYYNEIYSGGYKKLQSKKICITLDDTSVINTLADFAREVVWYGRNRRATDYTSTHYKINVC